MKEKGYDLSLEEVKTVADLIKEEVLFQYVDRLISRSETILEINPSFTEKEILQALAQNVVEFLGAEAASIRIYDPGKEEMISFGSYPNQTEDREETIPFEDTIAGEVVKTHRSYFVPNILKEEKYKNKEKVQRRGIHSMLAIPISIPRFSLRDVDTEGSLQIYYREIDKTFTPLEVKIAEMLSRRVSYVIARKRILGLQKLNVTKDKIVEQIFVKLGKTGRDQDKGCLQPGHPRVGGHHADPEVFPLLCDGRPAAGCLGSRLSRDTARDWKDLFCEGTLYRCHCEPDRPFR